MRFQTKQTTALAASLVVKDAPGTLYHLSGYDTAAEFIQVHDAATVPANTAVPKIVIPVAAGGKFELNLLAGLEFENGIVVCTSSTGPTKTIGGSTMWAQTQYL